MCSSLSRLSKPYRNISCVSLNCLFSTQGLMLFSVFKCVRTKYLLVLEYWFKTTSHLKISDCTPPIWWCSLWYNLNMATTRDFAIQQTVLWISEQEWFLAIFRIFASIYEKQTSHSSNFIHEQLLTWITENSLHHNTYTICIFTNCYTFYPHCPLQRHVFHFFWHFMMKRLTNS